MADTLRRARPARSPAMMRVLATTVPSLSLPAAEDGPCSVKFLVIRSIRFQPPRPLPDISIGLAIVQSFRFALHHPCSFAASIAASIVAQFKVIRQRVERCLPFKRLGGDFPCTFCCAPLLRIPAIRFALAGSLRKLRAEAGDQVQRFIRK